MESLQLIYQNGHFYNKKNNTRTAFKEGSEFCVIASSEKDFLKPEPAGRWPIQPNSSSDILKEIKKDSTNHYVKILDQGSFLYFDISRESNKYSFKLELLEDLYIYKPAQNADSDYKLYDCWCVTKENTSDNIRFFEEVYGKSLNDLFKSTYVHYFENKGNPASNAFITFYAINKGEKVLLDDYRNKAKSDDKNSL